MSLFSTIANFFSGKKETTTTTNIAPTTSGVKVTDFTSGESVQTTTTTSPTGQTTVTRTASSAGGGSVSPQREQQLISATQSLEQSQAAKVVTQPQLTPQERQAAIAEQQQSQGNQTTTTPQRGRVGFGGTVRTREVPATQQNAVIVTDTNQGSVTTRINPRGQVVSREVQYAEGSNPEDLVVASVREEGLVTTTAQSLQSTSVSPSGNVSPTIRPGSIAEKVLTFLGQGTVFPAIKYKGKEVSAPVTLSQIKQAYANEILPIVLRPSPLSISLFNTPRAVTNFESKVIAEFIPTTYGSSILFVVAPSIYTKLPTILRFGVSSYIAYEGVKGATDISYAPETRVASVIAGVAGATGAVFEVLPYIRGITARFSPKYKPVETAPEGFKTIKTPEIQTEIGLIPPGYPSRSGATVGVELPGESPLVKGGFHRTSGGESIFIGENQQLATSQRGLFAEGKNLALETELFVTPQEPFLKIAETRLSRLGLGEDLFSVPKQTTIGFGIPGKPQIGVVQAGVRRYETGTAFRLGTGTELEATKSYGTIINVRRIGTTVIQGQGVDIFSFRIGKVRKTSILDVYSGTTTEGTTRISGEGLFATTGISRGRKITTAPTTKTIFTSLSVSTGTINFATGKTTARGTGATGTSTRISSMLTPQISPPFSPPRSPPRSPPVSPPLTPRMTPPFSPPRSPPRQPPKNPPSRKFTTGITKTPSLFGGFNVFVRRQGRFRQVGGNLSLGGAFNLGERVTQKGLSQTFKVRGTRGQGTPFRVPKGFYAKQSAKEGIVFIEQPRTKINTRSEKFLLNIARRRR